ncbi:MAG: hypothetical protein WC503_02410 [Candidatus Shapirobacteria bacterium]
MAVKATIVLVAIFVAIFLLAQLPEKSQNNGLGILLLSSIVLGFIVKLIKNQN